MTRKGWTVKIIARRRSAAVYLEQLDDRTGRILDEGRGLKYPATPLQSIFARGYWDRFEADAQLVERLEKLSEFRPTAPADEAVHI
jgi:hypothetical protein